MLRSATRLLPALASAMLLAGAMRAEAAPARSAAGWEESGAATWYGGRHNGRRTSSGATFDDRKMTAAHPSLPLGSRVRVTMQETGESVVVLVNDRQPPSATRVIDLSRGAAGRIGLLGRGRGMVTLTLAGPGETVQEAVQEVAEAPAYDDAVAGEPAPRRRGVRSARRGGRAHAARVSTRAAVRTVSAAPAHRARGTARRL